jgi:asparagine synthase (glutamine-hydrolysing)
MCGIAGILNLDGAPADQLLLKRMARTMDYRGPDGTGTYTDGALGLVHNRLSIIDIDGGHQPMECEDGAVWITFNGELFNYIELREELLQKGHKFKRSSDTEVILRLYLEYGPACVKRMNGQWSFAIWDTRRKRLFLSRDRVGVRPLFYTQAGKSFVFGSEIKALLAHPGVERELDLDTLRQIFTYWFPLGAKTAFQNISSLPPGHSMIIEDGNFEIQSYWQLDFSAADTAPAVDGIREQAYVDEFAHLLMDSTQIRLRADVPVGAYLSGGLDSSVISALAQKCMGSAVHTFSVAFEDPTLDESKYQADVVQKLGTRHQTIWCKTQDVARVFPQVVSHTECPILRTAPAPLFLLSHLVRQSGFKVALTGEGSDEFLGGYDIYKEAKIRAFWGAHPESSRRAALLKRLYPYMEGIQKQPLPYLRSFFHVSGEGVNSPFFSHIPRWSATSRTQFFFSREVREHWAARQQYSDVAELLPSEFSSWSVFSRAQYLESAGLLPGYLLSSQGDRVTMANSVEGRYPFLDYRIVEFALKLPLQLKMKVLNEKYLLKRAYGHVVPASVRERPKQPYRAPDAASFYDPATGEARDSYVDELLSPGSIRAKGLFDSDAVQKLVAKAKSGRASGFADNAALVGILSTQILVDQFIQRPQGAILDAKCPVGSA